MKKFECGKYRLNVACGTDIREDMINVDVLPPCDIQRDIRKGLPFCDNSTEYILCKHTLEHFVYEDVMFIMSEFYRILKPDGILEVFVPHKEASKAWNIIHKTYWDEGTFEFFKQKDKLKRYGIKEWEILELLRNNRDDIYCKMKPIKEGNEKN